ncbi:hypothetical protein Vadar_024708 [Vaccinium darrowii]|uniref:Uncharacterized protein n=1 Tax=Vaccinium darrowii TaxID=229202 RepID=A0ACB7ZMM9_9ERIC|nr:hypothetical protein Vadar_024708 [Vaccinium darrowii]
MLSSHLRRHRGGALRTLPLLLLLLLLQLIILPSTSSLDFIFNSFNATTTNSSLILVRDTRLDPPVLQLTNGSNQYSTGRVFHRTQIQMIKTPPTSNSTATISSFSTSFVFSILPQLSTSPGFGLVFALSNSTSPPDALSGQYLGLFANRPSSTPFPLLAVEFDVGRNSEFKDPDNNHVGIDLNNIESAVTATAGYYNSTAAGDDLIPLDMRNGQNIHAWIEFDGTQFEINVTIAPIGVSKPIKPLIRFQDPVIANYVSSEMYVGFSASKTTWVETQRILAWSFSDIGVAKEINTTDLPVFALRTSSSNLSAGAISAKLYTHGETPNTTRVVGTLGYLAPELATTAAPTAASDVFSFGVVVLEVACGRRPIETAKEREEEVVLIDWVREMYGEGRVSEAADGRIKGEYEVEEMEAVLKLGLACCHPDPVRRPSMREVVAVLIGGKEVATVPKVLLSELAQGGVGIGGSEAEGEPSTPQVLV